MRIPDGPSGVMTVSASQIRTYGAGGFRLDTHEDSKGCPRLYKAKYVDRNLPPETKSYALSYGSLWHSVMELVETSELTPEEALLASFPADGTPEMMAEAKADLTAYMERAASPRDRFGTLAVEHEFEHVLYIDEEYGEVRWRGFLDWVGIDLDQPNVLHLVDYKTNRFPPSVEQVEQDVQLKSYAWMAWACCEEFGIPQDRVRVIVHLDAIKWREIEVEYTVDELNDWHDWAVALCRRILRDETADPIVNPGCDHCPIQKDCPAFEALPETAQAMVDGLVKIEDREGRLRWRDAANAVRLLLEKSVKKIDADFKATALSEGGMVVGTQEWRVEQKWDDQWDLPALHRAMGDRFYEVVNPVKGRITAVTKDWTPDALAGVQRAMTRVPGDVEVKRGKRRDENE